MVGTAFQAGGALIPGAQIFPWQLTPDSSVIFGCIFLGDAFYFLYGLLRPRWNNALGQLLSFLAYDLVLIVPFIGLFPTVKPEFMLNLVVYTAVLIYSAALAAYLTSCISRSALENASYARAYCALSSALLQEVYYLFFNPQTRFGS